MVERSCEPGLLHRNALAATELETERWGRKEPAQWADRKHGYFAGLGGHAGHQCQSHTEPLSRSAPQGGREACFPPGPKTTALGCRGGRSGRGSHPSLKRALGSEQPGLGPVRVIQGDEQYSWYLLLKTHKGKYLAKCLFASGTFYMVEWSPSVSMGGLIKNKLEKCLSRAVNLETFCALVGSVPQPQTVGQGAPT